MANTISDTRSGWRRVEVLTGPGRRRSWDAAAKAQVVAESYAPGAVVSAVARRWQMAPQQLFTWRREARAAGRVASPAGALDFVPILSDPPRGGAVRSPAAIEVEMAGVVVRVGPGVDPAWLLTVLRAVRASASPA